MTQVKISSAEKAAVEAIMGTKTRKAYKGYVRKNTSQTFWTEMRIRHGLTLDDVSEMAGVSRQSINNYLIGAVKPSRTTSDKICELFDVDKDEGYKEFENAYNVYHNTHGKTIKVAPKKDDKIINERVDKYIPKVIQKAATTPTPIKKESNDFGSDIEILLEALYEILNWKQYRDLVLTINGHQTEIDWEEILDRSYGELDRAYYATLLKLKG